MENEERIPSQGCRLNCMQRQLSCPVQRQLGWPVDGELKLSVS
jgi:hypothetical protein